MARGNKHTLFYLPNNITSSQTSGKPQCMYVFVCDSSVSGERKMQKRMDIVPEPRGRSR